MLRIDTQRRPAYALTDLAATLATVAILACLAAAALSETRRVSQLDESIANLKRVAAGTESYAADNAGALWGFTWQPGETHEFLDENGDLIEIELPFGILQASEYQATHLIRLMDDRVGENAVPVPSNWLPQVFYSHLPLVHYLGAHPLDRWTADPGDRVRLNWKDDPINKFDEGFWLPLQPEPTPTNARWPYSASYHAVPAAWDPNQSDLEDGLFARIQQSSYHNGYVVPADAELRAGKLADVAYPAHKVHVRDSHQRHFGPCDRYYAMPDARLPLAFLDGAVAVRQTRDANPGWAPNNPTEPCDLFTYQPGAWDPPICPDDEAVVTGYYNWTRAGMKGIDFGALPLDTGQATPGECDL